VTAAIERLRELHAEYWKAAGPFKMPPNNPPESMALFELTHHYVAVSAIALPALLECAEAVQYIAETRDCYHVRITPDTPSYTVDHFNRTCGVCRARAALDALAKEVGT